MRHSHDPAGGGGVSVHTRGRENVKISLQSSGGQLQKISTNAATEFHARNVTS